jgi:hypothetical protein
MRVTKRVWFSWLLLGALVACGDEPPVVEQRKELLRPDEIRRRRVEELERQRVFDAKGELIGSGEELAELEMPRGLKLYRQLEREHYLEAPNITLEQLDRYFAPRLEPYGVERTATSLTFERARVKDKPHVPAVTVRIARVQTSGAPACDVTLKVAPPPRVFKTEEQSQRELAERQKYAQ